MGKTQSQTENISIKKEEEEDCKPMLGVDSVTVTTRSKITKRKSPIMSNISLPAQ
jgi:hypothetical protein